VRSRPGPRRRTQPQARTLPFHERRCLTENKFLFIGFLLAGCTCLFVATAFFNLGCMLAVPAENRAFAIALLTFSIHAFGDVPAPVVVGFLKDAWAPSCRVNAAGEFDDPDKCRAEKGGIQLTIFATFCWMWVCVAFALGGQCIAKGRSRRAARAEAARLSDRLSSSQP
jgi:hypothetical protein